MIQVCVLGEDLISGTRFNSWQINIRQTFGVNVETMEWTPDLPQETARGQTWKRVKGKRRDEEMYGPGAGLFTLWGPTFTLPSSVVLYS